MKLTNKKIVVCMFIIFISLFVGANKTNAINSTYDARSSFANGLVRKTGNIVNGRAEYVVDSRNYMASYNNIYCIEHHQNIADSNIRLNYTGTYEYDSDSDSQFVRAAAYILKYGLDNGIGGYSPMNGGGNGGACQQALWHLEYEFIGGANNGLLPFAGKNSGDVIEPWIPDNVEKSGVMGTNNLYNTATQVGIIPYTSPINNSTISIDMSTEGIYSTCSLEGFYGEGLQQITEIKIKYDGDTTQYDSNSKKFRIYSDENFSKRIDDLSKITEPNATFYLENLDSKKIASIEVKGISHASGYKILIHHFENQANASQDLIVPEKVEPQDASFSGTAKNKINDSRLQIIKRDKKTKKGISDLYIKIYCVGTGEDRQSGWITTSNGSGELTRKESDAYKFKTDANGKIELNQITRLGEYHIYEFKSNSNYNKLTENEKIYDIKMQKEYYQNIARSDPNNFQNNESIVYLGNANVNKLNKLFRITKYQVKNPTLEIIKQDNRSKIGISDLFIKIYCIGNDGERGWISTSDGSGELTGEKNAKTFRTDNDGKIKLDKLAKLGRYFIYECKSNSDYNKLTESEKIYTIEAQRDLYKEYVDPIGASDEECVYLGEVNVNEVNIAYKVFKSQVRTKKLTIRKMDYDTNTLLDNVGFKIFYKELPKKNSNKNPEYGWLGYDQKNDKIVYGESFNEAFTFKTGNKYNGDVEENKGYTGEINLNNLKEGKYYIFEVENSTVPAISDYSIKDQPGYKYENNSEWNIPEDAEYALIGPDAYKQGYVQVDFVDGYSYDFYRSEKVDGTEKNRVNYIYLSEYQRSTTSDETRYYSTSHASVTVRNKKHTELAIEKKYVDSAGNVNKINNAGIKVLVKLKETIQQDGTTFDKDTYAWLKDEKGALAKNIKDAKEFVTGSKGQEEGVYKITGVPYGTYIFYEVTPPKGFTLEEQTGYNKGLPNDSAYDKKVNGKWSDLSSPNHVRINEEKTIQAKNASDVGNNENEAVLLSGQYSFNFQYKDDPVKYLGIEKNGIKNGQQAKYYTTTEINNKNAYSFNVSYAGHGYYRIKHKGTEMFLGNTEGTKVGQYSFNADNNNQLWKFVSKYSSTYRIVNKANGGMIGRLSTTSNDVIIETSNPLNFTIEAPEKNIEKGNKENRTDTESIPNIKASLQIYKIDKTYKQDLDRNEDIYLSAKLAIYSRNTGKWISIDNEGTAKENNEISYIYVTNKNTAENPLKICNLVAGNYDIYEVDTPEGYNIENQDGYMNSNNKDPNSFSKNNKWVYLKSVKVTTSGDTVKVPLENTKVVKITGKVWVDKKDPTKGGGIDSIYTSDSTDELLNGITVNLISHKGGENKKIATTTTRNINNVDGMYAFEAKDNGDFITYWEAAYCHVEFIYDNKNYVLATPFSGETEEQKSNNSKAIPDNVKTDGGATLNDERTNKGELYDGNLAGVDENSEFCGKSRTYIGATSGLNAVSIEENKTNNQNSQENKLLTAFYNSYNYTVENINQGLIGKMNQSIEVDEKLEAVKIIRNDANGNYEFTYRDDGDFAIAGTGINQDIIKLENRTYNPYVYATDIKYNFAEENRNKDDKNKYQVYLVYKIRVKNNNTLGYDDIYKEQYFKLTKLTNKFDNTLYELNNEDIGFEKNAAWSSNGDTAECTVDRNLAPLEAWDVYIQFKVKNDSLPDINNDNKNFTVAEGYHKYTRIDKNWADGISSNWDWENVTPKEHFTENENKETFAIGMEWQHREARSLSGNIFEDNVDSLKGANKERIGNGKLDDGENSVKGVVVSLIDTKTGQVAKLYNGELEKREDGKWYSTSKDAVFTVGEDGKYELKGVVPGTYYLQFTYGNDTTKEIKTSIKGETIDINLYKSTILTGNAGDETKNEKNWFLDNEEHSIALDSDDIIQKRISEENLKEEINHSTSPDQEVIDAKSPVMDIQFEYIKDTEVKNLNDAHNNLKENLSDMNFGIIERPKVDIQLEKNIKNIKYTLQNNTTIINGDPHIQNVSPYLASWHKDDYDDGAQIELEPSLLYGSEISVTYEIIIHNESELDYATERYYKYGKIENDDDIVKTAVTRIVDYIDNASPRYEAEDKITIENIDENKYLTVGAKEANKKYGKKLFVAADDGKLLTPSFKAQDGSDTEKYEIKVSNLLSNSDELFGWDNYSEIVGIRNITKTPQSISHFGSLEIKNPDTDELDDANITISLTSPTGENRSLTIYCIIGGSLIIMAIGLVCILKIIKKK